MKKNSSVEIVYTNDGRITIPRSIRRVLNLTKEDRFSVEVEDNKIILEKISDSCDLCGSINNTKDYENIKLCEKCKETLKRVVTDEK